MSILCIAWCSARSTWEQSMTLQYEFAVINLRTGARDQIRATATSESQARDAIVVYYADTHAIADAAHCTRPAHSVFGEINCL